MFANRNFNTGCSVKITKVDYFCEKCAIAMAIQRIKKESLTQSTNIL